MGLKEGKTMKKRIITALAFSFALTLCCSCGKAEPDSLSENKAAPVALKDTAGSDSSLPEKGGKQIKVCDLSETTDYIKYHTLDSIIENSDLIVTGEFIEDGISEFAYDDPENKKLLYDAKTKNVFRIDRVLKGDVTADTVTILQNYGIDNAGEEEKLYSFSGLSPMFKGSKWIYCLRKPVLEKDPDYYYPTGDSEGRYPLPEDHNIPDSFGFTNGYLDAAKFPHDVYSSLLEKYSLK